MLLVEEEEEEEEENRGLVAWWLFHEAEGEVFRPCSRGLAMPRET